MGMVVRTNMAAINANNSLQQASKAQQNGMQKLATGFKINKAADDASGLAISEKMKNQIKALDTAKDNCEDGANLIQTAEGYMSETHEILNRMTELAEKAANGTLGDEDRKSLQDEMDQLCGEIDRIATTANFNGHKLLDGSLGGKEKVTLECKGNKVCYNSPSDTGTTSIVNNLEVKFDDKLKDGNYTYDNANDKWVDSNGNDVDAGKITVDFQVGDKVTFGAVGDKTSETANGAILNADLTSVANTKDKTYVYDGTDWIEEGGTAKLADAGLDPAAKALDDGTVVRKGDKGIKLQIGESSTTADKLDVKINSFHTDTLFAGLDGFVNTTNDTTDKEASAEVVINGVKRTEDAAGNITRTYATDGSGNTSSTYKNAVSINISDQNNASAAADAIRQVSSYVSDERGKLGAQQNRLDHTVNTLTTASENTSAANSRIRDTDMAKEMMAYTSKNVIAQAAQSMLAQANSQPQNVLSLLQ